MPAAPCIDRQAGQDAAVVSLGLGHQNVIACPKGHRREFVTAMDHALACDYYRQGT
jgi:hypothetical protein